MNNAKARTLFYDFIIVIIFLPLILLAISVYQSFLCACFAAVFGPIIALVLGLFFIIGLCFLNHSKNKKEPDLKWYSFIIYIVIAVVIFIIVNVAVIMLNDFVDFDLNSNF